MRFLIENIADVFYVGNTEVIKNPTDKQWQDMLREQRKLHPNSISDPLIRYTYGEFGNYYIWPAYEKTHYDVEWFIYKNFNERCNQNRQFDLFNYYYLN